MYLDNYLANLGEAFNLAKTPKEKADIHDKAEKWRLSQNNTYQGSKDGSTYTGPLAVVSHTGISDPASSHPIEQAAENAEVHTGQTVDPTEVIGQQYGGSPGQTPSSNLYEIKTAQEGFSLGKTTNGLTAVLGNTLDGFWKVVSYGMGFVQQYASAIIGIAFIVAISKVISIKKK